MPLVAKAEHITIDGHFSPARTIPGPNYSIGDALDKPAALSSTASGSSSWRPTLGSDRTPAAGRRGATL
jgi:hypothetical protein